MALLNLYIHFRHGFSGRYCETQQRFCLSLPCQNNATCLEHQETYSCQCLKGFAGKNCHVEINECASSPCLHGGECTDLIGGFKCTCPSSHKGNFRNYSFSAATVEDETYAFFLQKSILEFSPSIQG